MVEEKAVFEDLQRVQLPAVFEMYGVDLVIDVGAHEGEYAERLRSGGYKGEIVSFEPVPGAFEELERKAKRDDGWTVHRLALGREDRTTTMNVVHGTLSSLLPATKFGAGRYPRLQEPEEVEVELRRLERVLDETVGGLDGRRPFLKLDTQGFDLDVFAGAGDAIDKFVGMQSELALMEIYKGMPQMRKALATYEKAGFEIAALYPVSRQTRTARVLEYDCVMVRASVLKKRKKGS
jgi:FkbM family methyltransferase